MRLIIAELDRLRSRRITLVALVVVVLAVGAFQFAVRPLVSPPSAEELAQARNSYTHDHEQWVRDHTEMERQCRDAGEPAENCVFPEPRVEDYVSEPESFATVAPITVMLSTYLVALAAFIVAGSFIGAEFSTGAISNWLTFVPRRLRVFGAKLVVIVVYAAVVGAAVTGLGLIATGLIADAAGASMGGVRGVVLQAGRGVAIPVALAVVGYCLGLLLRHTAAVVGVLLGYMFVYLVRTVLGQFVPFISELARWTPEANLSAILSKSYTFLVIRRGAGGDMEPVERTIGLAHGLVYWGALLTVLIIGSAVVFRRRDVT
jgi:ABC-2 type transport system permease protein